MKHSCLYFLTLTISLVIAGSCGWLLGFSDGTDSFQFTDAANPCFLEAQSLLQGKFALSSRVHDSALYNGRIVNVFQPGQTLFFFAHLLVKGQDALAYFQLELFFIFLCSFYFFFHAVVRLSGGKVLFSGFLAISIFCGAPYMASFPVALEGSMYRVNHCFSLLFLSVALFLLSQKLTTARYFWIGGCVGLAVLFRIQNIGVLVLPLCMLLQDANAQSWTIRKKVMDPVSRRELLKKCAFLLVCPVLASMIIVGFQIGRFGSPFKTGYAYIYEGRNDYLAQRAKTYGLMSLHFLPENVFRTFWAAPQLEFEGWRIAKVIGDPRGNSLIFSQPILLLFCLLWRRFRDVRVQAFILVTGLLAIPVLLYHNPGLFAPGYMRLSLDYLLLWAATLAVGVKDVRGSNIILIGVTGTLTVWAVGYVILLIQ